MRNFLIFEIGKPDENQSLGFLDCTIFYKRHLVI